MFELTSRRDPLSLHHDLLIELGRIEMAMEHLSHRAETERQQARPRLEQRARQLRDALQRLRV